MKSGIKSGKQTSHNSSIVLCILILVVLLISLVSCVNTSEPISTVTPQVTSILPTSELINTTTPQVTSNLPENEWNIYTDQGIGFTIKFPSTWYYYRSLTSNDDPSLGGYVLFSSALGNTSNQTRSEDEAARLVVSFVPNTSNADVNSLLQGSPLVAYDVTRPTINGIDAIRIITPSEAEVDLSSHIFLFLVTQSFQYSLVGTISASPNSSQLSDMVISMQDSFAPKQEF